MVITMLDGSPKMKKSNSALHLDQMELLLPGNEIERFCVNKSVPSEAALNKIVGSDVLIIAFSLYIDGLCAKLLETLLILEPMFRASDNRPMVYAIANNGFYEGRQNIWALQMIQAFCKRAGLTFGQGIGIGAGEMIGGFLAGGMPSGKVFLKDYGKVMNCLAESIRARASGENLYCSPNCPAIVFRIFAEQGFWNSKARKNGVKINQLH